MKLLLILLVSFSTFANIHMAPKSFKTSKNRQAVFMDITSADYKITYHTFWRSASVTTKIDFVINEEGYPIFDLVPRVRKLYIDGKRTKVKRIKLPHKSGKAKLMLRKLKPGKHTLIMRHKLRKLARFGVHFGVFKRTVNSGFFIRDLKSRKFVEQFLPTNLEFDQYPMKLDVQVKGTSLPHKLVTNGRTTTIEDNHFSVEYPNYFTASSVYFHIFPEGKYQEKSGFLQSVSGEKIPLYVYTKRNKNPNTFFQEAQKIFKELEKDYGPYGHPSLTIFGTGRSGGMEFPGAMTTVLSSLDHELLHSYFAKGVMPANGNTGWLDEAIASWRDYGYQRNSKPDFGRTNIGNRSPYARNTDKRSYKVGRSFMAYIDYKLTKNGGLKKYLKQFFKEFNHKLIKTKDFIQFLEINSGQSFQKDFDYYILNTFNDKAPKSINDEHIHQGFNAKDLESILGED